MDGSGSRNIMDDFVIPKITTTLDVSSVEHVQEQDGETISPSKHTGGNGYSKFTNTGPTFLESSNNLEMRLEPKMKESHTSCSSLEGDTIYLLVSGKNFCISKNALLSFPNTKLGRLAKRHSSNQGRIEYVFDRNSKIVAAILDFYRTGELHLPRNLCSLSIRRELRYWGISNDLISECCFGRYKDALKEMSIVDELDKVVFTQSHPYPGSYKEQIWNVMEKPGSTFMSWIWLGIYMTFIMLSVVLVSISTMQRYRVERDIEDRNRNDGSIFENLINTELSSTLAVIDVIGLVFFTIEPLVRLWACPSPRVHLKEFLNVLDFLLALDHWVCLSLEASDRLMNRHRSARIAVTVLRSVLSLRALRIFHLTRKNVKTKVLLLTFRASLTDILLLLLGLSIGVMTFATCIYYAEMIYDTENFQNIPEAIWWAIITMTTVGYGDYYPTTFPGYVVGVACALCGLLLLSMPIAVTATNFNTYYCGLVAREQRQRRKEALKACQCGMSDRKRKDSEDSIVSNEPTMTTNCDIGSKDDVFWFEDFNDYNKYHYQSDGVLEIRGVNQHNSALTPASLLHAASENSLCPSSALARKNFANHELRNNEEKPKPNYVPPKSNLPKRNLSTSSIITSNTETIVSNYNSINTDRNSNKKSQQVDNDNNIAQMKTRQPLDSVDLIKKRRRKYRARKKAMGSSFHLDNGN